MIHIQLSIVEVLAMIKVRSELRGGKGETKKLRRGNENLRCCAAQCPLLDQPTKGLGFTLTSTHMFVEVCSSIRSVGAGDLESCRFLNMTLVPFCRAKHIFKSCHKTSWEQLLTFTRKPPPVIPELLPMPTTVVLLPAHETNVDFSN